MRIEQRIMHKTVIGAPFVTSNIFTLLRSRLVVGRDEMYETSMMKFVHDAEANLSEIIEINLFVTNKMCFSCIRAIRAQ